VSTIDVTVAAVVERGGRFLLVEERVGGRVVLNQPAGHLEPGESLLDAAIREAREETGLAFEPRHLIGVYLWRSDADHRSFLRVAFCGGASGGLDAMPLDPCVIATHWLRYAEILARADQLRSPMVRRCIDDYLAGAHYPLACLTSLLPAQSAASLSTASGRAS
jgi:8-oxo-dGTP pyrophosphatase MutT (NUDIX family)